MVRSRRNVNRKARILARILRERIERGGRREKEEEIESRTRIWSQDLYYFDEQERDQSLCLSACDGSNPKQWLTPIVYTKART
jgi:hypothetical protein